MKYAIDTLVRAWVSDNRDYIEENYEDVFHWLKDYIENGDAWYVDFFDSDDCESMKESEMKEQAMEYIEKFMAVTPADILD